MLVSSFFAAFLHHPLWIMILLFKSALMDVAKNMIKRHSRKPSAMPIFLETIDPNAAAYKTILNMLYYRALWTLPERIHLVHTFIVLVFPSMMALTFCIFGTHFRLVLRFEWLTFLPNIKPFLHISQTLATNNTSFTSKPRLKQ